jgi:tetratricopeptide (TPR) repeat protein
MKMKSFILILTCLSFSIASFAQKNEFNSAKTNYEKYAQLKGTPGVDKISTASIKTAKEAIDKASVNEKTMADPAVWAYRALIYADLALLDTVETSSAPIFAEAINSLKKATELDKDGANKALLAKVPGILKDVRLNQGIRAYMGKDLPKAYAHFKEGLAYEPKDSILTLYAGLAALQSKDYKSAIAQYSAAIANKQINTDVYNTLAELYFTEKDTVSAIKVATEGATKYPANPDLVTKEIEYSLMMGKNKEIIDKITEQAKKDPKNKLNPYYLGIAYTGMDDYPKAEQAYKDAIAIDPNFADAYMNLGGLIMQGGINLYNAANKLPASQNAQYTEAMKKANDEFDRALPYLQKSAELNPKSKPTFQNMKLYYQVKRDAAKMAEMQAKIDALP